MAIDSEKKRRSVQGYNGIEGVLPTPDGTVDANDREGVSGLYAGITAENPSGLSILNFMGGYGRGFGTGFSRGIG